MDCTGEKLSVKVITEQGEKFMKGKCAVFIAALFIGMTAVSDYDPSGVSVVRTVSAASGVTVAVHTKEEIVEYYRTHPFSTSKKDEYASEPSLESPYSAGKLTDESVQNGLNALNFVRYTAGLDEVKISEDYCALTQVASLVNAMNGGISHFPERPSGLTDELYDTGCQGAGSSNLADGYSNVASSIIEGYMSDNYSSLIPIMGHRRWCLNPSMQYTGFGEVGRYGAMYAFDSFSGKTDVSGVCWPAQNMPVELCHDDYIWTYSRGKEVNGGSVKVKLTRKSDSKTWNLYSGSSEGDFYVNNDGYGRKGCIIFRPRNVSYSAGDVFDVNITGADTEINYTVTFFDMNNVQSEPEEPVKSEPEETVNGDIDGNGSVSTCDLIMIRKYIIGSDRSASASAADINGDGSVDMKDFLAVKEILMQ